MPGIEPVGISGDEQPATQVLEFGIGHDRVDQGLASPLPRTAESTNRSHR